MAEDQDKKDEGNFDFTAEGEVLGYISSDQARVLAMRTARETPGAYGRRFTRMPMAFDVASEEETEDHYVITLSIRPQGQPNATPGQEQFFIEKEGTVAHRQVLSLPLPTGDRRFPVIPAIIGVGVVGAIAVVGIVFAVNGLGDRGTDEFQAAVVTPTDTPSPTTVPAPTPTTSAIVGVNSNATPTNTPRIFAKGFDPLRPLRSAHVGPDLR